VRKLGRKRRSPERLEVDPPTEFLTRTKEVWDVLGSVGKYVCQAFRSFGAVGALISMSEFLRKLGRKRRSPERLEVDPTVHSFAFLALSKIRTGV
jgi:hypothetical protein